MSPLDWERLQRIFHRVLEVRPEERGTLLDAECGEDVALRREVEALLAEAGEAEPWIGRAVAEAAADLVAVPRAELVGTSLGPYQILQRLGEGGMGEVFLAEQHEPIHRQVALKTIKLGMDTRDVLRRFEAERQALALMSHPCIARVLDAGTTPDGRPYFVMDLVRGPTIREYCDQRRLPVARRLELFLDVVAGVQHAHLQGIVHRDLKPSNVLVEEHEGKPVPKIIDFGIAKAIGGEDRDRTRLTSRGHFLGTPAYMSPEQAGLGAGAVDARTDVYSLGVLLYELLVGSPPLDPETLRSAAHEEVLRLVREVDPPRPSARIATLASTSPVTRSRSTERSALRRALQGDLDWITLKALEKDPARRYLTPSELAADIRRHFDHEAVQAGPPTLGYRARKFVRRHRGGVLAASVITLALVAGVIGTTIGLLRASRARLDATRSAEVANATTQFLLGLFKESYPDRARGTPPSAREILDRGAQRIATELRDQPRVRARVSGIISDVYRQIGEYPQAKRLGMAEVALIESAPPVDSLALATAYNRLGILMRITDRRDSALILYQRALAIRERWLKPEDPDLVASLSNLANLYGVMLDFERGIPLTRRVLAIRERLLRPDDPLLGATYNNLATMLSQSGDRQGAREYYEKNLRIQEAQPGPATPWLASALYNLGGLEFDLDHYEAARGLYERALILLEKLYAPDHVEISAALLNIGKVAARQGDFGRAESTLARAAQIRARVFGLQSPMLAKVDRARGEMWRLKGEYPRAQRALQRAIRTFESAGRTDSLEAATTWIDYADCLRDMKDGDGERAALGHALQIREALLSPGDSAVAEVEQRLGSGS
ncbi:MAG TPA: serine/threonine-protein kinase [Candidatus Sulfotelmatobacter sp.]|nr:serine/threonine-protein kinase [Candidatus Sulfotelmatobacter sp.]